LREPIDTLLFIELVYSFDIFLKFENALAFGFSWLPFSAAWPTPMMCEDKLCTTDDRLVVEELWNDT
jgi:hypothetical protein